MGNDSSDQIKWAETVIARIHAMGREYPRYLITSVLRWSLGWAAGFAIFASRTERPPWTREGAELIAIVAVLWGTARLLFELFPVYITIDAYGLAMKRSSSNRWWPPDKVKLLSAVSVKAGISRVEFEVESRRGRRRRIVVGTPTEVADRVRQHLAPMAARSVASEFATNLQPPLAISYAPPESEQKTPRGPIALTVMGWILIAIGIGCGLVAAIIGKRSAALVFAGLGLWCVAQGLVGIYFVQIMRAVFRSKKR